MKHYLDFLKRVLVGTPDAALTVRSLLIVVYLSGERAPVLSRNLAKALALPKPTVSRLVKSLVRMGLVERYRGKKDRRDCLLMVSEKGRAFATDIAAETARAA